MCVHGGGRGGERGRGGEGRRGEKREGGEERGRREKGTYELLGLHSSQG